MIGSLELAAALLLAAAGIGKVAAPGSAALMLRRAWPRAARGPIAQPVVRAAGLIELAVAVAAIVVGDRVAAALLALCYLVFLAVSTRLYVTGQHDSCGCFGATESPVGLAHLLVNAAAIGSAVVAVARPAGSLGGFVDSGGLVAVVGVGQALLLAYLAFLCMTALPALAAARRRLLETA